MEPIFCNPKVALVESSCIFLTLNGMSFHIAELSSGVAVATSAKQGDTFSKN